MSQLIDLLVKDAKEKMENSEKELRVSRDLLSIRKVSNPIINWEHTRPLARMGGTDWEHLEYSFTEIERIADIDSYLMQSFVKKLGLALKEGYSFVSMNTPYVTYIEKRMEQIAYATSISTYELIQSILMDLIKFSNCFVVKIRNVDSSGGFEYLDKKTGKKMKPIAGLYVIPAATVEIRTDDNKNQVIKYRQYLDDDKLKYREYNVEDVAHFYINKKEGFIAGTPKCLPVIEDIKALRRMEESVELLTMQNIFPLIHYKVGTEENPARKLPSGLTEIDEVLNEVQHAPPEGIYVTSERHEIRVIGSENKALRVETYIEHFKKRVIAGLGMSSVDMGEGDTANRSTADSMSRSLVDEVKSLQKSFEEQFRRLIINPLLLESGEAIDLSSIENIVSLEFEEIDHETKVKKENAIIQKWLQSLISVDEARTELGYNSLKEEDWTKHYNQMITQANLLVGAATAAAPYAAAESEYTSVEQEHVKAGESREDKVTAKQAAMKAKTPSGGSVSNRARPSNQHGTKSSSKKSTKDSVSFKVDLLDIKDYSATDIKNDLKLKNSLEGELKSYDVALVVSVYKDRIKAQINGKVKDSFISGLENSGLSGLSFSDYEIMRKYKDSKDYTNKYIDKFFDQVEEYSRNNNYNYEKIINLLDSIGYRLAVIERTESSRAYNWGYVNGLKIQGINEFTYDMNQDTDENEARKIRDTQFYTTEAKFLEIAPWHPNSTIKVRRKDV